MYLVACKGNQIPAGVIKPAQMASVLTEVHIIDGSLNTMTSLPDTMYKYGTGRYVLLFKKYHTDTTAFKNSFKYYSYHPEILQTIYDQVTSNLKKKTDSLNKIQLQTNKVQQQQINKSQLPKKNALPQ